MSIYGFRLAGAAIMRGWLKVYHRLEIRGRGNLPSDGPYVIVSNHTSHLDAACIVSALPLRMIHRVFPAAASDYFFISLPRLALAAVVINALPFDRELHIRQSLKLCQHLLTDAGAGNVLVLFPEGTRSISGELGDFQPGIGLLTAGTPIPVIPAWIEGARGARPKGARFPRPRKIRLILGESREYDHLSRNKANAQYIASDLRDAVQYLAANREPES